MIAMKYVRAAALVALLAAACVKASDPTPPDKCVFKRMDVKDFDDIEFDLLRSVDDEACVKAMPGEFLVGLKDDDSDKSFEALLMAMFLANTLKHVPTPAIAALKDGKFCERFGQMHEHEATFPLVMRMTDDQIKALPAKCVQIKEVLDAMKPSQIRLLDLSAAEVTALHDNENLLRNIGWEQFQAWVGTEFDKCDKFNAIDLTKLSPEVLAKMDSRCLSRAKNASSLDDSASMALLRSLNPESIKTWPAAGFAKDFTQRLTPAFLKNVDSATAEASLQCDALPLADVNYHHVGSLSKQCAVNSFKKAMTAMTTTPTPAAAPAKINFSLPRFLHNDFFSAFEDADITTFVTAANTGNVSYDSLKSEHYADLVKYDTFCEKMILTTTYHGLRLPEVITPNCFAKAQFSVQELLLKNYVLRLPANILSALDSLNENLLAVFKEVAKTRPELLAQVAPSKAEGEGHPCRSWNVSLFKNKDAKKLAAALPTACLKSLDELDSVAAKDLGLLPAGLLAVINLQAVISKAAEPENWKLSNLEWSAFLEKPELCALIPEDRVVNVPMALMSSSECFAALKPKFGPTQLHSLKPNFLKSLPPTVVDKIRSLLSTVQQQNLPQPPKPAAPPAVVPAK